MSEIEFVTVKEVKDFLKYWEEHHTLSRNLLRSFEAALEDMQ
jgi:hypothetical protein